MGKETVLPKNIRQIGDIQGTDRICLEDYVATYIRKKESQEEQGYLGILLGEERKEEYVYVFIRGILEVPEEEMENEQLQEYLKTECEKYFPDCRIQGCCIIGAYPAAKMEKLTALIPEAGQLLYHLQEQEESVYRLTDGQYHRIHGYFIFYEQNPEMQEYLAQVFQEDHAEKEILPDNAIKSFREKVKEKGMQKHTDFLRLAGSFLVITVLAVGAIAVNRVDEIRTIRELSGDITQENEVPDEEVAVLREWTDVNPVEYVMDPVTEISDETETAISKDNMELPGSDAFWDDNYEDTIDSDKDTADLNETDTSTEETERQQMNPETEEAEETVQVSARQVQSVYVIRAGDTLADICNKYYGSMELLEEICRINEISDANLVMPGQKIVLP